MELFIFAAFSFMAVILLTGGSKYRFVRVVDGDTIVVSKGKKQITVRLIGVDCPESNSTRFGQPEPFGKEAKQYTEKFLTGAKAVSLSFDKQKTDKYGRMLAYVSYNNKSLNESLLANGYAIAKHYSPNTKYKVRFEALEKKARAKGIGMFAEKRKKKAKKFDLSFLMRSFGMSVSR